MIDPSKNEKKAMETASERAGEYLEWLKKTDMETFTPEEWSQFVEVIVSGYSEGMSNLAEEMLEIDI
jgi:hypothetical protein